MTRASQYCDVASKVKCFVDVILTGRQEEAKVVPCAIGLACNGEIRARPERTRQVSDRFLRLREGGKDI